MAVFGLMLNWVESLPSRLGREVPRLEEGAVAPIWGGHDADG